MKTKFSGILTLLLAFMVQIAFAQSTVSGTVSDDTAPLPGANVIVKGSSNGTQTDFDGNFTLSNVNPTDVLIFSYVGFKTQEVPVGNQTTFTITLELDNTLEEVIVTALGVKREAKSLGSSISVVEAERLEAQPISDIGSILRGEAAGLNITNTTGVSGAATSINIRGFTSITGSNQPLFIVDGVPLISDVISDPNGNNNDNLNQSNSFLDIDPNNIESVNVLKGLNASVLYGQLGRNGVILITTKTGSGKGSSGASKTEISITSSGFISEAILPDYQNEFGGGFSGFFGNFVSNFGPSFTDNRDEDFVGQFDRREGNTVFVTNPLNNVADQSLLAGLGVIGEAVPFAPARSVENFFRTGFVSNTSISARGGNQDANFTATYSNLDDRSAIPGNTLRRNNASIGGQIKLSNNFTVGGSALYTRTETDSPPIAPGGGFAIGTGGNGSSLFSDLLFTPRHIDLFNLPFQALDGRSVYYRSGNDIQNPRWTLANASVSSRSTRFIGNVRLNYTINDHWNINNQASINSVTTFFRNGQNRGGVSGNVLGFLNTSQVQNDIFDDNLTVNGQYDIGKKSNIGFVFGGNLRSIETVTQAQTNTDQLVFGVVRAFNFVNQTSAENTSVENTAALFADATYSYDDYLFINGSVRNEWTSTLETGNNSILFPGTSVSFIPTTAFENLSGNFLSYLKVRGSYGESAGFPGPFQTRNILALNARSFANPLNDNAIIASNAVSNTLANPDLEPERIREFELGVDTRLIKNKFGLNVSIYQRNTNDLISVRNLDPATGFANTTINSGELEVQGIEIDFDIKALKIGNFSWKINGNFNADESTIISLPEGIDQIQIGNSPSNSGVANFAIAGEAFGVIQGFAIQRDANGNPIINPGDGLFLTDPDLSIIGDPNPDWTGTLINTFDWKGLSFSFEWQYVQGGDFFSTTASTLLGRGNVDVGIDRRSNFIIPGVFPNGQPNDIVLTSADLLFNVNANSENQIYDATTIRLNEASLTYTFPKKVLEKTPFGRLSLRASGNNLWFRAVNIPREINFDTNSLSTGVGNGRGIEALTGPSTRRYGITVTATF